METNLKEEIDKLDEDEEIKNVFKLRQQYVYEVLDFSSQYGSDISISYTARNIIGKPSVYPNYGDFEQTFMLRTYGNWWREAPSKDTEFMVPYEKIHGEDFIDLLFEHKVYPKLLFIYETYNPGAIVRIYANEAMYKKSNGKVVGIPINNWHLIWEQPPQSVQQKCSRIFKPDIKEINIPIKLEFNQSHLDYYTAIDAVSLFGTDVRCSFKEDQKIERLKPIKKKILEMNLSAASNFDSSIVKDETYLNNLLFKATQLMIEEALTATPCGAFTILPDETIVKIFSYLDLFTLSRCTRVNKRFKELATDALLYTEINFKPYWNLIDKYTLRSFVKRCKFLQKLDLSWCTHKVAAPDFIFFIQHCGSHLTHLKLNCCKLVYYTSCIKAISKHCAKLKELSLQNWGCDSGDSYLSLSVLNHLERLDLYRAKIESSALVRILKSNPKLKHLNVGACGHITDMDDIAFALSAYNHELISVNFWKSYSLSNQGVLALSNCKQLEELDVGWCINIDTAGDCLLNLSRSCMKLKRLVISALHGLTDDNIIPIFELCSQLEQIDLLGLQGVSARACEHAFRSCHNLKFIDISFCKQILDEHVNLWRKQYPHISIKKSIKPKFYDELPVQDS